MVPNTRNDSADFGIWPTLVGWAIAIFIFTLMFSLATGFA